LSQTLAELGLSEDLVRTIATLGIEAPTPLQEQAIPPVLAGRDLLAEAAPGSGVTASFVWPLLERLRAAPREAAPRAARVLVLAPTRELAIQCDECLRHSAGESPLRSALLFGGVSPVPQVQALAPGVDLLAATTRRLLDHLAQSTVDLAQVECLVINVGERVLDTGFLRDVERIVQALPEGRQVLLYAAGMTNDLRAFAQRLLRDPVLIQLAAPAAEGEVETDADGQSPRREPRRTGRGPAEGQGRAPERGNRRPGNAYVHPNGNVAPPRERMAALPNGNVAYAQEEPPSRAPRGDRQPASNENQLFPSSGAVYGHGPGQGARRGRRTGRGGGQPPNGYPYRD
jgi:hypothetical protein